MTAPIAGPLFGANAPDIILLAKLGEIGAEIADARIGNRVALAPAMLKGRGVTEASSSRAAEEIASFAHEIARRAGI